MAKRISFQSLLHQGISLLNEIINQSGNVKRRVSIPSSSGHQFTECVFGQSVGGLGDGVSIPSSSGHQFTDWLELE